MQVRNTDFSNLHACFMSVFQSIKARESLEQAFVVEFSCIIMDIVLFLKKKKNYITARLKWA